MKVLFVYKYLTLGGCETVIRARIEGLDAEGIEGHAWFFQDLGGGALFAGVSPRVRVGDLNDCERAIATEGFDVVATIDTEEIFPFFCLGGDLPALVVEAHSPHAENLEYLRDLPGVPVAACLVPSAHQGAIVRELLSVDAPVIVVPNPVRPIFCGDLGPGGPAGSIPLVAWVGRLDAMKNWPEFIAIAGHVRSLGVDAEFRLVGRPVRPETVDELLGSLEAEGVADRVRWYRGLEHARLPAFFDRVRDSGGVVVVTSRGESFGMVAAEAMARGCACLLADQPPLSELAFGGRAAPTYPPGDVDAAAREVRGLLAEDAHRARLGLRAREEILARHSPSAAIPALARTLRWIAAQRSRDVP